MRELLWTMVFGPVGVLLRYGVDRGVATLAWRPEAGTLAINTFGCFAAGVAFVAGFERAWISPEIRTGVMVGLLGGFTTFSAFGLQLARLIEGGSWGWTGLYVGASVLRWKPVAIFCASVALGIGAAALGLWIARTAGA